MVFCLLFICCIILFIVHFFQPLKGWLDGVEGADFVYGVAKRPKKKRAKFYYKIEKLQNDAGQGIFRVRKSTLIFDGFGHFLQFFFCGFKLFFWIE